MEPRPELLSGVTYKMQIGCGHLYVIINHKDGKPFETFLKAGKAGGCVSAQCEAIGRLVSAILRGGLGSGVARQQLQGINCHSTTGERLSCADAVALALERFDEDYQSERDGVHGYRPSGHPSGSRERVLREERDREELDPGSDPAPDLRGDTTPGSEEGLEPHDQEPGEQG